MAKNIYIIIYDLWSAEKLYFLRGDWYNIEIFGLVQEFLGWKDC